MTTTIPRRRALVDLPVNTIAALSITNKMKKAITGQKRPHSAIDQDENVSSPDSDRTLMGDDNVAGGDAARKASVVSQDSPPYSPITDPPTPQDKAEVQREEDSQLSCKDSVSSVNDFDPDDSVQSQQTEATEVSQPIRPRVSELTERLRLRLQLAHFKIRTNQVNVPFAQLKILGEHEPSTRPSRESTSKPLELPSLPALLPAPVLNPTAYSSRTVTWPDSPSSSEVGSEQGIAHEDGDDGSRTPALPRKRAPVAAYEMNSPSKRQKDSIQESDDDDLTSSAIKGSAAASLMGLRRQ